jgi:hypothetical protein
MSSIDEGNLSPEERLTLECFEKAKSETDEVYGPLVALGAQIAMATQKSYQDLSLAFNLATTSTPTEKQIIIFHECLYFDSHLSNRYAHSHGFTEEQLAKVLPYACAVIGRVVLEVRERLPAPSRYKHPWVLVLEEAHNYARPARADEDRGHKLARLSYERIAKEGRKFGLSLIIASQRPSEISQTIISQCANFISHRLQNPDDIDHFKRIIPMQARRLLDQVTILASGEAIVFGSAFHVPARVQFDRPNPGPYSQTAAPYHEWRTETNPFPVDDVVTAWGLNQQSPAADSEPLGGPDDDIPF